MQFRIGLWASSAGSKRAHLLCGCVDICMQHTPCMHIVNVLTILATFVVCELCHYHCHSQCATTVASEGVLLCRLTNSKV